MTIKNLTFHENDNWKIEFITHDADGVVLPLTSGASADFIVSGMVAGEAVELVRYTIDNGGIVVTEAEQGEGYLIITREQQAASGIVSGGVYFYEFRVVSGLVDAVQAEGQLLVERSLFSTVVDPLLFDFQARFPEFTEDDTTISLYIQDARRVIEADDSWRAADRPTAIAYLAAHLLQMHKIAKQRTDSGGVETGQVKSISVEDRTVTFATTSGSQAQVKTGINETVYGQQYLAMLRRNPIFLKRA